MKPTTPDALVRRSVAALLWLSRLWRVRDEVVGTALLLGCAAVFVLLDLLGFQDTGLGSLALLLVALFVPFGAATCYLAVPMSRLGATVPAGPGTRRPGAALLGTRHSVVRPCSPGTR
ncbi:hypothetical protein ABGB07_31115 [Micromonosporaceae bacterium B7E4]